VFIADTTAVIDNTVIITIAIIAAVVIIVIVIVVAVLIYCYKVKNRYSEAIFLNFRMYRHQVTETCDRGFFGTDASKDLPFSWYGTLLTLSILSLNRSG